MIVSSPFLQARLVGVNKGQVGHLQSTFPRQELPLTLVILLIFLFICFWSFSYL